MPLDHLQYLPLAFPFFAILVGLFILLVVLLELRLLRYAYLRLGVSSRGALLLLVGSLLGSYFNIPVADLPQQTVMSDREVSYFGMTYVVPMLIAEPRTIIAINVGGALIPGVMSLYLMARHGLWVRGLIAIAIVAWICHSLAHPIPGVGIALPIFVPAAATAVVALIVAPGRAAPLAYIGGSFGVLIGADLLNLGNVAGLQAPVASIGGAGTFDGIFLIGIVAVLMASFSGPRRAAR
jgi:uncharacterized membrane protein